MRPSDNPFAMDRLERMLVFRPDWVGTTWDNLLLRASSQGSTLSITGRHGAGKTTFLDALAARLEASGQLVARLFFNDTTHALATALETLPDDLENTIVLLDGATHLGWPDRLRLGRRLASARRILQTRHHCGRHPVLLHLAPDAALLHRCVREVAPIHYPLLAPSLDAWFRADKQNIRLVLRKCYDAAADLPA